MATDRMKVVFGHLQKGSAKCLPSITKTSAVTHAMAHGQTFRYTLDNPLLSQGQRKFYEENGFLVIPKLIEDELLDECRWFHYSVVVGTSRGVFQNESDVDSRIKQRCVIEFLTAEDIAPIEIHRRLLKVQPTFRQRFVDVCDGTVSKANMTLMKEKSLAKTGAQGEHLYYKLQDIVWDDVLSKYILHDKLLDYIQCFTGPNIMAMHSMLINKPPDAGSNTSKHPLHQDLHYFPFRPADRIVAAWTAMERVTLDNGCLVVAPGSHKGTLLPHGYPEWENGANKAFHGIQGYHPDSIVPLEMEKGDTVFFHPILIHGSGVNITKGFRKAISCHYAASDCEYIDVRGTTQENIAKEVVEMAKRKGVELDFQDVWRYRNRLARGKEKSL